MVIWTSDMTYIGISSLDSHALRLGRSGCSIADKKCRTSHIGATESAKGRPCSGLSRSVMGSFFLENKPFSKGQ